MTPLNILPADKDRFLINTVESRYALNWDVDYRPVYQLAKATKRQKTKLPFTKYIECQILEKYKINGFFFITIKIYVFCASSLIFFFVFREIFSSFQNLYKKALSADKSAQMKCFGQGLCMKLNLLPLLAYVC